MFDDRIAVALPSAPWLMCAVYRHIELKFVVVSARTRATSMSRLCRNFSNIRIRLAVEIPLILSVATLYIYIYIYIYIYMSHAVRVAAFTQSRSLWRCVPYPAACPKPVYDKFLCLSLFAIWLWDSKCHSVSFFMFIFIWGT